MRGIQVISRVFFILAIVCFIVGIVDMIQDQMEEEKPESIETEAEKVIETETIRETVDETKKKPETADLNEVKDDRLILVNKEHPVPADWKLDLVDLDPRYGTNEQIDRRAYPDLMRLLADAEARGFHPIICSGYRSHERQVRLFEKERAHFEEQGYSMEEAEQLAAEWVAVPGSSEHELGLAMDIVPEDYQLLDGAQGDTAFQKWLMENCSSYGFILRYPQNKESVTGIEFESWHYRYVGVEAAIDMKNKGLCLEEYLHRIEAN